MQMILVDWTRMGTLFCLAGVVEEGGRFRTVRPLPVQVGSVAARKLGWSAEQTAGLRRWEAVELIVPKAAGAERPHTEDVWVLGLRRSGPAAPVAVRRAILEGTSAGADGGPLFGAPLVHTTASAFLAPGSGDRSLATVMLASRGIVFRASLREGQTDPDVRVKLPIPGIGIKWPPVKDHVLLTAWETAAGGSLERLGELLTARVRGMGAGLAVRLGLSRGFDSGRGEPRCWLMADGFFSAEDPQA